MMIFIHAQQLTRLEVPVYYDYFTFESTALAGRFVTARAALHQGSIVTTRERPRRASLT